MRTIDDLRAALADTSTPPGVDVGAVRGRAVRTRRRRAVLAAAATAVAAAAVTVPAATLHRAEPPSVPAAPQAADGCPNSYPAALHNTGPGLDESLVPFPVTGMLLCQYRSPALTQPLPLSASRVIGQTDARALVDTMGAGPASTPGPNQACTDEYRYPVILIVAGHGRSVTLDIDPSGCTRVTNGVLTGRVDKRLLLQVEEAAPARLRCPSRFEDVPAAQPTSRPLVAVRADLLMICEYTWSGTLIPSGWREFDGAGARDVVRGWEARLPLGVHPCPGPLPDRDERILVLVRGEGRTIRLVGTKDSCRILSNGSQVIQDVDWSKLLPPRK